MKQSMAAAFFAVGFGTLCLLGSAAPGLAQPAADHLTCYRITDPQATARYTADLGGLVVEPGCTIQVPARIACVPATATNVSPTPPVAGVTGSSNGFFCYKVKCPRVALPTHAGTDQFGSRTVMPRAAKLVCAPLAGPPTTTTTSTTSTTSTTMRFADNGDGTVTDHVTGLQWERKSTMDDVVNAADPHDSDNTYAWSSTGTAPDGPAFTQFLAMLNDCGSADGRTITNPGFAGHCDWRLPTIAEFQTLIDRTAPDCRAPFYGPCIDPVFGPTWSSFYWSASEAPQQPTGAWGVDFLGGGVEFGFKTDPFYVRAVRGGS